MTIAIHISTDKNQNIRESFNFKCFTKIAAEQPAHHFIFIFDTHPDPELYLDPNCTPHILSPELKNSLLRHYWYNYKIPALLQRFNADVFVTTGNTCSLRTKVPQCMIVESFSLSQNQRSHYLKKFLPSFLSIAKSICITNSILEEELIKEYEVEKHKITVLYPGLNNNFNINTWNQNEQIKEKYTGGRDFFLYNVSQGEIKSVIKILKSFSLFKKLQKSNMQLILLLKSAPDTAFLSVIKNYKYRDDIIPYPESKMAILLPAAYASIHSSNNYKKGLHAMQCGVPLISIKNTITEKAFLKGALYVELNEKEISEKMSLLYKDEHLRREYVAKGAQVAAPYSWKSTTAALWEILTTIAKQ